MIDRSANLLYKLAGRCEDVFAAVVVWLQGEPVALHYVAAVAVTWLARWGVHLSPESTTFVGLAATAVAAWAARRKVWKRSSVEAHAEAAYVAGKSKQRRPTLT